MRRTTQQRVASEIPTSSMADIAFLLIIFFMVTSTFAATRGLDFSFPEQDDELFVEPVEAVFVEVQRGGALRVDGRPMQLTGLLDYLRPKLELDPLKPVIVKPKPDAEYGYMVGVLDELRQGKEVLALAEHIAVALPTEREALLLWQ